jgi:hypothetical protein
VAAETIERRRYPDEASFAVGRRRMWREGWLVRRVTRRGVAPGGAYAIDGTLDETPSVAVPSIPVELGAASGGSTYADSALLLGLGAIAAAAGLLTLASRRRRRAPSSEIEVDYGRRRGGKRRHLLWPAEPPSDEE